MFGLRLMWLFVSESGTKRRLQQGGRPYGQVERQQVDCDLEIRGNEKLQSNSKINTVM